MPDYTYSVLDAPKPLLKALLKDELFLDQVFRIHKEHSRAIRFVTSHMDFEAMVEAACTVAKEMGRPFTLCAINEFACATLVDCNARGIHASRDHNGIGGQGAPDVQMQFEAILDAQTTAHYARVKKVKPSYRASLEQGLARLSPNDLTRFLWERDLQRYDHLLPFNEVDIRSVAQFFPLEEEV